MFKQASYSEDIYRAMEKNLAPRHELNKLAQATELLKAAAEIFEDAGMTDTAADIAQVLQDLPKATS